MSEVIRKWVIMCNDGTPLEEVKAFHLRHAAEIVNEVTRLDSIPEESLALHREVDALIKQVRNPCNLPKTVVE